MTTASRRTLERDIVNLTHTYSMVVLIHALVETCHGYRPHEESALWDEMCMYLRAAEDVAQRLRQTH